MVTRIDALLRDEDGLTSVEYALLLAVIAVAGLFTWRGLGLTIRNNVTGASGSINNIGA